jgi:hypothetical protein
MHYIDQRIRICPDEGCGATLEWALSADAERQERIAKPETINAPNTAGFDPLAGLPARSVFSRVVDVPTINREIEYLDEAIARSDRPEGEMELMSDFRSTLWVLVNGHSRIDHANALRDENERLRKLLSEADLAALAFYAGGEK